MKRVYVNEKWCLGCHLCEYNCAFANSREDDMVKALKGVTIHPRIQVEEHDGVCFAVSCRHCEEPLCVKGCITGALSVNSGMITIDRDKCVGCFTCVLSCPYGAIMPDETGHAVQKCELCTKNACGEPACVKGCPNRAIVFEER
ncbi:MAG: 4Fe-4S dicluster domain-containing protein [Oscillospiraceae bacterium]|nr:4Fe-4S binding protein [Oscillospiraceae bacterium]MDY3066084.1 4Fe-4S dicluster domain-containing protein [Oscillospiraceae bacterium]